MYVKEKPTSLSKSLIVSEINAMQDFAMPAPCPFMASLFNDSNANLFQQKHKTQNKSKTMSKLGCQLFDSKFKIYASNILQFGNEYL